jgi:hypothetical protein
MLFSTFTIQKHKERWDTRIEHMEYRLRNDIMPYLNFPVRCKGAHPITLFRMSNFLNIRTIQEGIKFYCIEPETDHYITYDQDRFVMPMENPGEGQCAFYCFYQAIAEKPAAKCTLTQSRLVRDLMKQYVNKDILRFFVEYDGQAVSLLGNVLLNYLSQNIQYDNVNKYYQKIISQKVNMKPLQTLWEEI